MKSATRNLSSVSIVLLCVASMKASGLDAASAPPQKWSAPVLISGNLNAVGPGGIALDDAGDGATAWVASPQGGGSYAVEGNTKTAQGNWSVPVTLPGGDPSYLQRPTVHSTALGVATAVWVDSSTIWTSESIRGGAWSKPVLLAVAPVSYSGYKFAMNRAGDSLLVVQTNTSQSQPQLDYLSRRSGQSWSAVKTFPASETFNFSDVAVGAGGVAAITGSTGFVPYTLHTLEANTVDGPWRNAGALPPSPYGQSLVTVDASGRIELATYAGDTSVIAYKSVGTSWSAPVKIAPPGYGVSAIATDDAGNATVLLLDGNSQTVSAAQGSIATNSWTSAVPLFKNLDSSLPGTFSGTFLDIAANGKAAASAVYGRHARYFKIQASHREAANGTWSPATLLPGQTDRECVEYGQSINPAGQAVILWSTYYSTRNEYVSSYK